MNLLEIIIPLLLLAAAVYLGLQHNLFALPPKGLPVLMYHNVTDDHADGINIPAEKLELQFMYLREKGYRSLSLKQLHDLENQGGKLPKRNVVLTFDDAYAGLEHLLLPLLERYDLSATIFLPVAFIGKTNLWDEGELKLMTAETLRKISGNPRVEIALHSFLHRSYDEMDAADAEEDLTNCKQTMEYYRIPYFCALAYPYGAYPKKDEWRKKELFNVLRKAGIIYAFRIGNRINPFPLKGRFELKRIDIRGDDSFFVFKTKLRKGRAKVFA